MSRYKITVDKAKYVLPLNNWGEPIYPDILKEVSSNGDRAYNAGLKGVKQPKVVERIVIKIDGEEFDITNMSDRFKRNVLNEMRNRYVRLDDASFMSFSNAHVATHENITAHETINTLSTLSEMGLYGVSVS